jgi:RimJ/RimL family protein N-acetyltransferase
VSTVAAEVLSRREPASIVDGAATVKTTEVPGAVMGGGLIRGTRVSLRQLRRSDAPGLDKVLRDGKATRWLPPRVRRESGREFVDRVLREQRQSRGLCFAIVPNGSSEAVGQIRLFDWSPLQRHAEVGYWIRRSCWGRGFGTEALRLICREGFRRWHLHRIVANVVAPNVASARLLEKVGFRHEGTSRSAARIAHTWVNELDYALLRADFHDNSRGD